MEVLYLLSYSGETPAWDIIMHSRTHFKHEF